jgi:hypothetical protein
MFYPISVSKTMLEFSKKSKKRFGEWFGRRIAIYIASVIVWFTTGIWHGAAWNFIVWGLLNCLVILISQECNPLYEKFHARFPVKHTFGYRLFEVTRTFWLMSFLRTFDCYRNVGTTFQMFESIVTKWNLSQVLSRGLFQLGLSLADYLILFLGVILMLTVSLMGRRGSVRSEISESPMPLRYVVSFILFTAILIFGAYGVGYDASQFIYSQF